MCVFCKNYNSEKQSDGMPNKTINMYFLECVVFNEILDLGTDTKDCWRHLMRISQTRKPFGRIYSFAEAFYMNETKPADQPCLTGNVHCSRL